MKRNSIIKIIFSVLSFLLLLGMSTPMKMTDARANNAVIQIETKPNLEIHEGYVSQKDEIIIVKQGRKTIVRVHLSEPVMVAMAEQEEQWGYFQFPGIGKATDGSLRITWQMNADSHKSYGTTSGRENLPMLSYDGGKTWRAEKKTIAG